MVSRRKRAKAKKKSAPFEGASLKVRIAEATRSFSFLRPRWSSQCHRELVEG
jgi:hypothetical protein